MTRNGHIGNTMLRSEGSVIRFDLTRPSVTEYDSDKVVIRPRRRSDMMRKRALHTGIVIAAAVLLAATLAGLRTAQAQSGTVRVGNTDLGGVVTSSKGAEAGVWVIAEATDLPTKFVKIVVTDDQGRYLVPELPKANYNVWVRG